MAYLGKKTFETAEELEEFFSQKRIPCFVCGRTFVNLGKHLHFHDTTPEQYRETHGIPATRALMPNHHRDLVCDNAKIVYDRKTKQGNRSINNGKPSNPKGINGKPTSFISAARQYNNEKIKELGKSRIGIKLDRCIGKCYICSIEIDIAANRKTRNTLCAKCKYEQRPGIDPVNRVPSTCTECGCGMLVHKKRVNFKKRVCYNCHSERVKKIALKQYPKNAARNTLNHRIAQVEKYKDDEFMLQFITKPDDAERR